MVAGFARGQGIKPSALIQRGGVYASVHEKGSETAQLLTKLLPELIRAISLPNSMRWGDLDFRFIRPIRWIVALYGTEVVPFTLANVTSENTSRGHRRFLHRTSLFLCPQNMRRRVKRHKGGRCTDSEMNLVQSSTFFVFPLVKVIALC